MGLFPSVSRTKLRVFAASIPIAFLAAGCGSAPAGGTAGATVSFASYCTASRQVKVWIGTLANLGASSTLGQVQSAFSGTDKAVIYIVAISPSAIQPYWSGLQGYFDAASKAAESSKTTAAASQALSGDLGQNPTTLSKDQKAVDSYTNTHCGFAISPTTSATPASASATPTP